MRARTTALALLPIVLVITQAGCKRAVDVPITTSSQSMRAWSPDEGAIIQPIRFRPADLDPARAHATTSRATPTPNGWPPTRSLVIKRHGAPWTCFRSARSEFSASSRSVRRACRSPPVSRRSWPTSGGRAWTRRASTRRRLTPLKDRLAAIEGLTEGHGVADYLRKIAAAGENPLFAFGPHADFKNSAMNIAYAVQGRPRLAGQDLLLRRGQEARFARPTKSTSPRCSNCQALRLTRRRRRRSPCSHSRRGLPAYRSRRKSCRGMFRCTTTRSKTAAADKLTAEFPLDDVLQGAGHRGAGEVLAGHSGLPPGSEQDARRRAGRAVAELSALSPGR